ncbi:MAG: hypothetical protein CMH53_00675 [Myxococcales bacterium]|nr:hypothetical protein [Myxococcales bacterium]
MNNLRSLSRRYGPQALLLSSALVFVTGSWQFITGGAALGDDHSSHLALGMHIARLFRAGITDLFWEHSNLGLPLFASYQPLPSLSLGALMAMAPGVSPMVLFNALVVLIWATMPFTWYLGARWLRIARPQALILALLWLLVRDQWKIGIAMTSSAHTGLFTQSCGLWLFPITVAALDRVLHQRNLSWVFASVLMALTLLSHLFIGLLSAIACACLMVGRGRLERSSFIALCKTASLSFVLCGFWLVPLLSTREYLGGLPWLNDNYDGWPPTQVVKALMGGALLDAQRFPWLTILAVVGLVRALPTALSTRLSRALCLFALVCLMLLGGREFWGEAYTSVPMHANVNPARYGVAIQLLALLMAAQALAQGLAWVSSLPPVLGRGAWLLVVVVSALVWIGQYHFVRNVFRALDLSQSTLPALAQVLEKDRDHRFMVAAKYKTGSHFHRDLLAMLADRAQLQSYALGFHATNSTYYAENIQISPESLRLFNVNTLVARYHHQPPRHFKRSQKVGEYTIYKSESATKSGYFDLVWPGPIAKGGLRALRKPLRTMAPELFKKRVVIRIEKEGSDSAVVEPWVDQGLTDPGKVLASERDLVEYRAQVDASAGAWLLLKVTYFPFWHAEIDGKPAQIHHVAPNFMALAMPAGRHKVRFRYRNPAAQKWAALGSLGAILVWLLWSLSTRFWGRHRQIEPVARAEDV